MIDTVSSETTPPTTGDGGAATGGPKEAPSEVKTLTQEQVDKIVEKRLAREREKFADYDTLKSKAEQLGALEAEREKSKRAKLSDEERYAADRADWEAKNAAWAEREKSLASEIESLKLSQLRAEVAAELSVPPALMSRLQGATREELVADANALLKVVTPSGQGGYTPPPVGGGAPPMDPQFSSANLAERLYRDMDF